MKKSSKNNSSNLLSAYIAHGDFVYRHQPVPIFIKARGPILEDRSGYKYFDAEAANGTASLGFDSDILEESMAKIKKIPAIPSFCETELRLELAEKIVKKIKKITKFSGKVAFELGGAQGVELALKIIKSNTRRSQFIVFEGAYHGRSIFTSQLSASHRYRSLIGDWRIPVVRLPYPDFDQYQTTLDKKTLIDYSLAYVKRLVELEVGGVVSKSGDPDVAALIIEPLLNAGGIVKPDKEYMEEIVKIFRKLGALIVVDEIFCGFYRTGPFFGFEHYNFTPDIIVMSKALTNGITPLSCVWAKNPLMSDKHFPPGTHSATFINSPLSLAIANTVFDNYENWTTKDKDIKKLEDLLNYTIKKIVSFSKLAKSGYVLGGVGRVLLKNNYAGKILDIARTIGYKNPIFGIHGLILASTGMASNVVAINPPLNLKEKERNCLSELLIHTFKKADELIV